MTPEKPKPVGADLCSAASADVEHGLHGRRCLTSQRTNRVRWEWLMGAFGVSLAGAAVDAFAQQVRVPDVAGVLLDHVHEDVAHRRGVVGKRHFGVHRNVLGQPRVGGRNLAAPGRPGLLNDGRVGKRTVEVVVTIGLGPVEPGHVMALQDSLKPMVLDLR